MVYIPPHIVTRLSEISCLEVAERLGIRVKSFKAFCFLHSEKVPSLSFRKNGKTWKCFSCGKGGNAIHLVMEHEKVDFVQACEFLCRQFGIYISPTQRPIKHNWKYQPVETNNDATGKCNTFNREIGDWVLANAVLSADAKSFLYQTRMLSSEVVDKLSIKSISHPYKLAEALRSCFTDNELIESGWITERCGKYYLGVFTPCLVFPYCDEAGRLTGIQTRYIGSNPKAPRFQFVGTEALSFFNAPLLATLKDDEPLAISEGVTDCMALLSAGYNAIAIPSATTIPIHELTRLVRYKLMMSVDHDKNQAGEKAFQKIRFSIIKAGGSISRIEYPSEYKDYGEYFAAIRSKKAEE